MSKFRGLVLVPILFVVAACSDSGEVTTPTASPSPTETLSEDQQAVKALVEASIAAENDQDVETFLDLWTDRGLEQYDVGSREDLLEDPGSFGEDSINLVAIPEIEVNGDEAAATAHASVGEESIANAIFEVELKAQRQDDGEWLLDGFEFKGGAPVPEDAPVVSVQGSEYAFAIQPSSAPGDLAIEFENVGEEAHEISLFLAPEGTDLAKAREDLIDVDGSSLEDLPDGYEVSHIAFAEPGQSMELSFANDLEAGTYVFACYLPVGGLNEEGDPVDPKAKSHFEMGMVNILTVE